MMGYGPRPSEVKVMAQVLFDYLLCSIHVQSLWAYPVLLVFLYGTTN